MGEGDRPPWSIGEPQPEIAALIEEGKFHGEVLDAGCGEAEASLYLAKRGFTTVGLDLSPTAIDMAREEAVRRGLTNASFEVADISCPLPAMTGASAPLSTARCFTRCPSGSATDISSRLCAPRLRALPTSFSSSPAAASPRGTYRTPSPRMNCARWCPSTGSLTRFRPARIHANVPEKSKDTLAARIGVDLRDEGNGRSSLGAWLLSAHLGC